MAKVVIVGAFPESLVNFRGDLIADLVQAGHQVTAMADHADPALVSKIEALGARFVGFPVQRNGMNPVDDLRTLAALYSQFRRLKPDVVLAYTIKPVVWGGISLRLLPGTRFFALVTGLGFAFQKGSMLRNALTALVTNLYRLSLKRASRVIFQNRDNLGVFADVGIVAERRCSVVSGSGVDVGRFHQVPLPAGPPCFLLIARLLGEKGLREYAEAARLVKERYPEAQFRLVGPPDPSPDGIPLETVRGWEERGIVNYLGSSSDVRPHLAGCHVYVLPSYHEGMPRTVLEAMAIGRPVLTTDVPGCRETVIQGHNGFLVPKADAQALAERMIWLIEHPDRWEIMGRLSREMAEERFDVRKVNLELMRIMGLNSDEAAF